VYITFRLHAVHTDSSEQYSKNEYECHYFSIITENAISVCLQAISLVAAYSFYREYTSYIELLMSHIEEPKVMFAEVCILYQLLCTYLSYLFVQVLKQEVQYMVGRTKFFLTKEEIDLIQKSVVLLLVCD
jgi:hypothetical protein